MLYAFIGYAVEALYGVHKVSHVARRSYSVVLFIFAFVQRTLYSKLRVLLYYIKNNLLRVNMCDKKRITNT